MATNNQVLKAALEALTTNPDAATARHFARRILEAALEPVSKEKCAFCGLGFKARDERIAGYVKKGKAMPAHDTCAAAYQARSDEATRLFAELDANRVSTFNLDTASTCACGHGAAAHAKDDLENLLACEASGCDCDHFHYSNDDEQKEAA